MRKPACAWMCTGGIGHGSWLRPVAHALAVGCVKRSHLSAHPTISAESTQMRPCCSTRFHTSPH
eukprot:364921-Chlamydomonas_euryale.AAC.5